MTTVRRPQGGNQGAGPNIEGYSSTKRGEKKSPVRKIGKGAKGRKY